MSWVAAVDAHTAANKAAAAKPGPASTNPTNPSPFSFGGGSTGSGLFGGGGGSTTGSGLFGQTAATGAGASTGTGGSTGGSLLSRLGPAPAPAAQQSTSLFGSQPASAPAPAASTSLFGAQQQPQAQGQAQASTGLFGIGNASTSTSNNQQQQLQPAFGSATGTGGLFGSQTQTQTQPQQQQGSNIFGLGQSQSQPQNQNLNQSQFQQPQAQTPQWSSNQGINVLAALQVDVPPGMLFEEMKVQFPGVAEVIEKIEEQLQGQKKIREGIQVKELGDKLVKDRQDITTIHSGLQIHRHALQTLRHRLDALNSQSEEITSVWNTCIQVVVAAKAGVANGGSGVAGQKVFYQEFFAKLAEQLKVQMDQYRRTIDQIERQLVNLNKTSHLPTPQAIAQTVSNNQNTIMGLAGDMSTLEDRIRALSDFYRQAYRQKMNTVVDPFIIARAEAGEPPLGHSGKRGERGLNDELNALRMG